LNRRSGTRTWPRRSATTAGPSPFPETLFRWKPPSPAKCSAPNNSPSSKTSSVFPLSFPFSLPLPPRIWAPSVSRPFSSNSHLIAGTSLFRSQTTCFRYPFVLFYDFVPSCDLVDVDGKWGLRLLRIGNFDIYFVFKDRDISFFFFFSIIRKMLATHPFN